MARGDISAVMDVPIPPEGFAFVTDDHSGSVADDDAGTLERAEGELAGAVSGRTVQEGVGEMEDGQTGTVS